MFFNTKAKLQKATKAQEDAFRKFLHFTCKLKYYDQMQKLHGKDAKYVNEMLMWRVIERIKKYTKRFIYIKNVKYIIWRTDNEFYFFSKDKYRTPFTAGSKQHQELLKLIED